MEHMKIALILCVALMLGIVCANDCHELLGGRDSSSCSSDPFANVVGGKSSIVSVSPVDRLEAVRLTDFAVETTSLTNVVRLLNDAIRSAYTNGSPPRVRVGVGPTRLAIQPRDNELRGIAEQLFEKSLSKYSISEDNAVLPVVSLRWKNGSAMDIVQDLAFETHLDWWQSGDDVVLRSNPDILVCAAWEADEEIAEKVRLIGTNNIALFFMDPSHGDTNAVAWIESRRIFLTVQLPYAIEEISQQFEVLGNRMKPLAMESR